MKLLLSLQDFKMLNNIKPLSVSLFKDPDINPTAIVN